MSGALKELDFILFSSSFFSCFILTFASLKRINYKLNSCMLYGTDAKPCSLMGHLAFIFEQ